MATEGGGRADDVGPTIDEEPPELPGDTEEDPEPARVGEYTWDDFKREFYYDENGDPPADWRGNVEAFDPADWLGFDPDELGERMDQGRQNAAKADFFLDFISTPVTKGEYTWTHFKYEFYLTDAGELPTDGNDSVVPFDAAEWLGFDADDTEETLGEGASKASALADIVDERTVNVDPEIDEDDFFSTFEGTTTVVNRYDLEKAVTMAKKRHFREIDRYWVNKPYSFVILFHSEKENEMKYYLVEPYTTPIEADLAEFLSGRLRTAIKYASDDVINATGEEARAEVIERETMRLLERYDLYFEKSESDGQFLDEFGSWLGDDGFGGMVKTRLDPLLDGSLTGADSATGEPDFLDGIAARPEPAVVADDEETLTTYQVEKLLYQLERDFIGYERIDGIKHDINVEDISCDGYDSPVFVYHTDYEQIITNVFHGTGELDNFVVKLAQRSGKGISKRQPQVDATLPDGSRAQLTLGREVSDHGTNYTIRQFKDVPFTPIDLINWHTFSLEEMALLWLCIENHKSLIFAGGTASGKTTSLNAVSLFIPSNTKIVSIEDTREVELPQRNWIASVTRPSFVEDGAGDVDEFDLLEAALRQRPDYIVMGEIRGEEGRTLFQVMSTGHTTYTTFHADSVGEVLKRFTTEPINVSKTMFTALDLVSVQTSTRVAGTKVRRNKSLTEINHYDAENDEINVQDVFEWRAEADEFANLGNSNTLQEIMFDRGWDAEELDDEMFKRQVVIAYLIREHLNEYAQVAATLQAFINDPETILALIATEQLEASLEDLREMESVLIDIDPEKEKMVPRPDPNDQAYERACEILAEAEERLFERYRDVEPESISTALAVQTEENYAADERPTPWNEGERGANDSRSDASVGAGSSIDELFDDELGVDEPADEEPNSDDSADEESVDEESVDEESVDDGLFDNEPVDEEGPQEDPVPYESSSDVSIGDIERESDDNDTPESWSDEEPEPEGDESNRDSPPSESTDRTPDDSAIDTSPGFQDENETDVDTPAAAGGTDDSWQDALGFGDEDDRDRSIQEGEIDGIEGESDADEFFMDETDADESSDSFGDFETVRFDEEDDSIEDDLAKDDPVEDE